MVKDLARILAAYPRTISRCLRIPMDRILRYHTTINRQLFQATNQLERLPRLRKRKNLPAPLTGVSLEKLRRKKYCNRFDLKF